MQQSIGLMSPGVDHHACGKGLVIDRLETYIEQFDDGVLAVCIELIEVRGTMPNAQVSLSVFWSNMLG